MSRRLPPKGPGITKQDEVQIIHDVSLIPDSEDTFKKALTLQIHAHNDDLEVYLKRRMGELPRLVQKDLVLQEEIKSAIIGATDGMYVIPYTPNVQICSHFI